MIEPIKHKKKIFGYIIRYKKKSGVNFLTPPKLTHQIAFIRHKKNHEINPHLHFKNVRKINYTSEVLIIQKGKIRVDIYSERKKYIFSKTLFKDDIVILNKGAHGFKILKPTDLIEVKQGPYNKKKDKSVFKKNTIKKNLDK